MTDDETYIEYIVKEEDVEKMYVDNAKGNENIQEKRLRTKREQIDKIVAFHKDYNEELIGKENFNDLWNNLTAELNAIGPPTHSNLRWKRVWTLHKYNLKKRGRSSNSGVPQSTSCQGEIAESDQIFINNHQDNSVLHQLLEKVCILIEKQDSIIEKLERSNDLLEVIAQKQ